MIDKNEGLAFLEAYRDALRNGYDFSNDLTIPYRACSGTSGKLRRLRTGIGLFYITEIMAPATAPSMNDRHIPVLIERPGHHKLQGGHVFFLDGHVEWIPYPGPFPMTEKFIQGLIALEDEVSQNEKTTQSVPEKVGASGAEDIPSATQRPRTGP